ncbi:RHS repeat-associated core domain-containing protein [Burkholderia sp. S-53]|uniref:RHS repeat-associated core domain-containing protein n=1 Tax=Burkholderia sp. S-53 TaxID=2906514 RepID=UPI0021CE9AA5|nr:RHS repeat-associated core domain-containing protein [Burkholderia sp. S-53]UXU85261.1 RHS repeat protein [Burkholderia sp. S-53]
MTTVSDAATARRCAGTPTVTVVDNRGLVVRTVQYSRTAIDDPLDELITRQSWSARGYLMTRIDPRLFDEQRLDPDVPPNFRYVRSLSGQPLTIASQDAGEQTALYDSDGGVVWQHDSRDQQLRRTYDTLHRLVSVTEQTGPATPRISERLLYGDATAADNANLRGQLRQAWSPAGMAETPSYSLAGQPLATVQQFLRDDVLDSDWASDDPGAWVRDLAPDTYTTRWAYNALGQELERVDACHNRQRQHFNVAGQLAASELQLADQSTWQPLLRAISYSAAGQVLREEAGNGVVTDYTYEPQTQRLAELHTTRPPQAGRTTLLQALSYQYDPVGNLLAIDDAAKATRYTRNQRVAPASHYSYDALYQLTRATGRENANAGRQSQALPAPIVPLFQEIGALTPYTRTYRYDRGANLTTLQHQGTRSSYTQQMVVAPTSNRAVPQTDGLTPGDVASYFDACGNLKALGASQPLAWDSRNQLQRTTQVVRRGADDDCEVYWYDGAGQRATKLGTARTSGTTRTQRVRYLPGLELRQTEQTPTDATTPTPVEILQVLTLGAAGRQSVRVLHWELGKPETIENDQWRVSLDDQIGSSTLEVDQHADILTWEEYYPFGGTSVWSARSDAEAKYKYVHYSSQERDATGLYYYGFRYYAPWLGRWINPDPAGPVDGLNLFCMVANNPLTFNDRKGLMGWPFKKNNHRTADSIVNVTKEDAYAKLFDKHQDNPVSVSEDTMNALLASRRTISQTRELLPFGAGNQAADLFSSGGESFLRANYAMAKGAGTISTNAKWSIHCQAGNCSGHADVAFSLLSAEKIGQPIGRASSNIEDHAFVIIGDPRDPIYDTVVVDVWPIFPTAFRLKDADNTLIDEMPTIKEWHSPGSDPLEIEASEPAHLKDIVSFFSKLGVPPPGNKLEKYLVTSNDRKQLAYNILFSINNPKTRYTAPGRMYDLKTDEANRNVYDRKTSALKRATHLGMKIP